jgi:tetratricopeptide (TPR) repeat protein
MGVNDAKPRRLKGVAVDPEAVLRARQEAGLSLAQVAQGDISRTAIYLIEKGRMRPTPATLQLIADRTGRPLSYFLAEEGVTPEQREDRDRIEAMVARSEFGRAIKLAKRLLASGLPLRLEADVQLALGRAYLGMHDGPQAHRHLVDAGRGYEQSDDPALTVDALEYECQALYMMADPRALPATLRALDLCERLQPVPSGLMMRILIQVGALYADHHVWTKARDYYERGLSLASDDSSTRHVAMLHDGLARSFAALGEFALALDHAQRALALSERSSDPIDQHRAEHDLAEVMLRNGDLPQATEHFERALQLCDEHHLTRDSRTLSLNGLAEARLLNNDLAGAERLLDEAMALAGELGERQQAARAQHLRGRLYVVLGDLDAAATAFAAAVAAYEVVGLARQAGECHAEHARALRRASQLEDSFNAWEAAFSAATGAVADRAPLRAAAEHAG